MMFSPKMYNMQLEMKCLYVFLVHWEGVERVSTGGEWDFPILLFLSFLLGRGVISTSTNNN